VKKSLKANIITLILPVLLLLGFNAQAQYQIHSNKIKSGYYSNPIFAGDYPDPSILRDGDNYYIVHSSNEP
jgi:hypothetical protein